jgi:predicted transcriptional regulator
MSSKKKVVKKITTKKPVERKRRYELVSSGNRGIIQNIEYAVPLKKNVGKTLSEIQEYVNIKSAQMKKTPGLMNSTVSVAVKFSNERYISTSYKEVGKKIDISSVYDQYGGEPEVYSKIVGFSILFIPNHKMF